MREAVVASVLIALALMGVWSVEAASVQGTAYDRLDLSSPAAAVDAFLRAYKKGDYVAAFWVFSLPAQRSWREHVNRLDFSRIVRGDFAKLRSLDLFDEMVPEPDGYEQEDISFLFAHMMNIAAAHALLPLDVTGWVDDPPAGDKPPAGAVAFPTGTAADILVRLKAYPESVQFKLEISPLGKWRIRQIILPGGNDKTLPWGLP